MASSLETKLMLFKVELNLESKSAGITKNEDVSNLLNTDTIERFKAKNPETDFLTLTNRITDAIDFVHFTNDEENFQNALNGQDSEYEILENFDKSNCVNPMNGKAQDIITLYDTDGSGKWEEDEFSLFATSGLGIEKTVDAEAEAYEAEGLLTPENLETYKDSARKDYKNLIHNLFTDLNFNDDESSIDDVELTSMLFDSVTDRKTGDITNRVSFLRWQTPDTENARSFYNYIKPLIA